MLAGALHVAVILQASPAAGQSSAGASPVLSVRVLPVEAVPAVETPLPRLELPPAAPAAAPAPVAEAPAAAPLRQATVVGSGPASPLPASTEAMRTVAPTATTSPAPEAAPSEARSVASPAAYPPLAAAPEYAQSGRLDPGPRALDDITPDYPEGHHSRTGAVVVRILIAANGTLDEVSVAQATPPGLFDRAAVEAVRRTRFAPGQLLGVPVKSQMTIEIGFAEINRGAAVSGRTY